MGDDPLGDAIRRMFVDEHPDDYDAWMQKVRKQLDEIEALCRGVLADCARIFAEMVKEMMDEEESDD